MQGKLLEPGSVDPGCSQPRFFERREIDDPGLNCFLRFCVRKNQSTNFGKPCTQRRCRIVTQQLSRLGNIGAGQRHVARLFGQLVDPGFPAERFFDRSDEIFQLDRFAFTEIKKIVERALVIERRPSRPG